MVCDTSLYSCFCPTSYIHLFLLFSPNPTNLHVLIFAKKITLYLQYFPFSLLSEPLDLYLEVASLGICNLYSHSNPRITSLQFSLPLHILIQTTSSLWELTVSCIFNTDTLLMCY